MQKTGQIERTVDSDFQDQQNKFKTYVTLGYTVTRCGIHTHHRLGLRKNVRPYKRIAKRTLTQCEVTSLYFFNFPMVTKLRSL